MGIYKILTEKSIGVLRKGKNKSGDSIHLMSSATNVHNNRLKILVNNQAQGSIPISYSKPKYFDSIKRSKVAIDTNLSECEFADKVIGFEIMHHDEISAYNNELRSNGHSEHLFQVIKDKWQEYSESHDDMGRSAIKKEADNYVKQKRIKMGLPVDDTRDNEKGFKKSRY